MSEKKVTPNSNTMEIIEKLIKKGKKRGGVLTYAEIMDVLQSEELSPDEIDDIYEVFTSKGIELVDEINENKKKKAKHKHLFTRKDINGKTICFSCEKIKYTREKK